MGKHQNRNFNEKWLWITVDGEDTVLCFSRRFIEGSCMGVGGIVSDYN